MRSPLGWRWYSVVTAAAGTMTNTQIAHYEAGSRQSHLHNQRPSPVLKGWCTALGT